MSIFLREPFRLNFFVLRITAVGFAALLAVIASAPLLADIKIITSEETVILKGELVTIETLPNGAAAADRGEAPPPAQSPPAQSPPEQPPKQSLGHQSRTEKYPTFNSASEPAGRKNLNNTANAGVVLGLPSRAIDPGKMRPTAARAAASQRLKKGFPLPGGGPAADVQSRSVALPPARKFNGAMVPNFPSLPKNSAVRLAALPLPLRAAAPPPTPLPPLVVAEISTGAAPSKRQISLPVTVPDRGMGEGRRWRVGPSREFRKPSDIAKKVSDGDTVEIDAGDYKDCAVWKASNLKIVGVGGKPHIRDKSCKGKGLWITDERSRNVVIENIEFSGMKVPSRNGSAIRHQGSGLTLKDVYIHDGESGLLTGNRHHDDEIVILNSWFRNIGKSGRAHSIYVGRGKSLTLKNSVVEECLDQSNCVKSRARTTTLSCNVINSGSGVSSWEVDVSEGGDANLSGNIIVQGEKSANSNIIGFAMESKGKKLAALQRFVAKDNLLLNDKKKGNFIAMQPVPGLLIKAEGNLAIGKGNVPKKGFRSFSSRRRAGMPAAPRLPQLPAMCRG